MDYRDITRQEAFDRLLFVREHLHNAELIDILDGVMVNLGRDEVVREWQDQEIRAQVDMNE